MIKSFRDKEAQLIWRGEVSKKLPRAIQQVARQQWRVCFRWKDGHAHDVSIVDYHR